MHLNYKLMLQQHNILVLPIRQYQETSEQIERLDYVLKSSKARLFYLKSLLNKYFRLLRSQYCHKSCQARLFFSRLVEGINNSRCQKIHNYMKKQVFNKFRAVRKSNLMKREKRKSYSQAIERGKITKILKEWRKVINLQIISNKFEKKREKQFSKEFIELLRENNSIIKRKKLEIAAQIVSIRDLHSRTIAKNVLQCFKLNVSTQKVVQSQRRKGFKQFLKYTRQVNKQDQQKGAKMFRRLTISKFFVMWKQSYYLQLAVKSDTQRLMNKFFNDWKLKVPYLQSQNQIQANNEIIVRIHLQKRVQRLRELMFKRWRQLATYQKQMNRHNSILNKFAEKQYRYMVMRRYFENLKINCLNNKVRLRYYQTKLKRKSVDAFKLYFQNSIAKESKVLEFMDKRYLKRYYKKINFFNEMEKEKSRVIRLRAMFRAFSNRIIAEYCQKDQLAVNFNKLNLFFKTFFILKKMRLERKQQSYVIVLINIILPLRRLYKNFRIRRYFREKQWFLKKSILREWRMRLIGKDSQRKIVKEFNEVQSARKALTSQGKLEMFEFQNIMATIAQIRSNFDSQKVGQKEDKWQKDISYSRIHKKEGECEMQTPSQSINFSYSFQTI